MQDPLESSLQTCRREPWIDRPEISAPSEAGLDYPLEV